MGVSVPARRLQARRGGMHLAGPRVPACFSSGGSGPIMRRRMFGSTRGKAVRESLRVRIIPFVLALTAAAFASVLVAPAASAHVGTGVVTCNSVTFASYALSDRHQHRRHRDRHGRRRNRRVEDVHLRGSLRYRRGPDRLRCRHAHGHGLRAVESAPRPELQRDPDHHLRRDRLVVQLARAACSRQLVLHHLAGGVAGSSSTNQTWRGRL